MESVVWGATSLTSSEAMAVGCVGVICYGYATLQFLRFIHKGK